MAFAQDASSGDSTDNSGGGGLGAGRGHRLSFLSAEDRAHLMRVRRQVLQSDPDLKAEQESLRQEWESVKSKGSDATPDDKEMLRNNARAHMEHMDDAMLKADPTIQPILDQIKAHMKERFQQAGGGNT